MTYENRLLSDEHAALRRVATLVAEGAEATELFAAVAGEVEHVLAVPTVMLARYGPGRAITVLAELNKPGFTVGSTWPLDGPSVSASVLDTAAPARIDDYGELPGSIAAGVRATNTGSTVGVPITVDGSVWGVMTVSAAAGEVVPPEIEDRLGDFTELIALALSNAESRERMQRLAAEQAALRRVATLVATAAPPGEVFAAVAEEVTRILDLQFVELDRFGSDGTATVIGASDGHPYPPDSTWLLDGPSIVEAVARTGRTARIEDYSELPGSIAAVAREAGIVSAIGAPIIVGGTTWGAIVAVSTSDTPIREGAEARLGLFTELVATAVSNVQAHNDVSNLVHEQAALRRVATLVAEGESAEELFLAVAREVGDVLGVSGTMLDRFEPDGTALTLATAHDPEWTAVENFFYAGLRRPPDPGSLAEQIQSTHRQARIDDYSELEGTVGDLSRKAGVGSGCSAPITVDGELWGAISVFARAGTQLPADTAARLEGFTALVGTAVSNAAARAELIASRARIVVAGDEARRRIERNLHDGTQQRLIALGLELQRVRAQIGTDDDGAQETIKHMESDLESILEDVRELSRGLHPPLLARRGLLPSLRALARHSPIPVEINVDLRERPPAGIETALYMVVSEALTNAIKHSHAENVTVIVEADHGGVPFGFGLDGTRGMMNLHATIVDDGIGGAAATEGSGLMGLADRVDALGGRFTLESPAGDGTRISVALPVGPTAS